MSTMISAFMNTSVFCHSSKTTVLPWTIVQLKEETHTFKEFFDCTIKPRLNVSCTLLSALVGPEKSSLDLVDTSIQVLPVLSSFGKFLKYNIEAERCNDLESQCSLSQSSEGTACSESGRMGFLSPIRVKNKKDALFNDLVAMFVSHKALLWEDEINSHGKKLISTLRDVLWHIDGHHATFAKRALTIPSLFQKFSNYNTPELSKHCKRQTCNISSDVLQAFVEDLCLILDSNYWERPHWKQIKPSVSQLCDGLASYVEYLSQKNKRAKINHRSPTPIRELSDNMKIKYFESIPESDVLQIHKPIDDLLANQLPYSPLSIQEHIPDDPVKKYRFLNLLESSGLSNSFMLLTYNPGSNLGKLAYVPEGKDFAHYLQESQQVIEEVKNFIPVYHTRAMRSLLFSKYGRLTSNVQPAVLRHLYKELTGMFIY